MENQEPNMPGLELVLRRLSHDGYFFGINSNRALEDVVVVYERFSLNGPLVLENGVYFKKSLDSKDTFLSGAVDALPDKLLQACRAFADQSHDDVQCRVVDTLLYIKSFSHDTDAVTILINRHRRYTGSLHIYRNGKRDRECAKRLSDYLRSYFSDMGEDLVVEVPEAFGNIVVYPASASKRGALIKMKEYYNGANFYLIGDDVGDAKVASVINGFFLL